MYVSGILVLGIQIAVTFTFLGSETLAAHHFWQCKSRILVTFTIVVSEAPTVKVEIGVTFHEAIQNHANQNCFLWDRFHTHVAPSQRRVIFRPLIRSARELSGTAVCPSQCSAELPRPAGAAERR